MSVSKQPPPGALANPPSQLLLRGFSISLLKRQEAISLQEERKQRKRKESRQITKWGSQLPSTPYFKLSVGCNCSGTWGKVGLRTLKSTAIWPFQQDNQHRLPATSHGQHPGMKSFPNQRLLVTVPLARRITKAEETSKHSCPGVNSVSYLYQWRGLSGAFCWLLPATSKSQK